MLLVRLEAAALQARVEAVRDVGGAAVDEVRAKALDGRLPCAAEEELLQLDPVVDAVVVHDKRIAGSG